MNKVPLKTDFSNEDFEICVECKHFLREDANFGYCILNPPKIVYKFEYIFYIFPRLNSFFAYPKLHVHSIACGKYEY